MKKFIQPTKTLIHSTWVWFLADYETFHHYFYFVSRCSILTIDEFSQMKKLFQIIFLSYVIFYTAVVFILLQMLELYIPVETRNYIVQSMYLGYLNKTETYLASI